MFQQVDSFDLEAWMTRHGIVAREAPWNGGGTRWLLNECPFNSDHRGTSVAILRAATGMLSFKCQHDGCAGKQWKDLRALLEPGWRPYAEGGQPRVTNTPTASIASATGSWPEPEDRGDAVLSEQGNVEYVEDLIRPGRIVVWAAEEGVGKSYAVDDELAIRMAVAGGSFAGTWRIVQRGGVLILSEMHSDDDYEREETTLAALNLDRGALKGHYYRLPLMTAANGTPALMEPAWRDWIVDWCRQHEIILQVYDTATGATQGDPWGEQIRDVFRSLRVMLETYPQLAIVLIVHLKKPSGNGAGRRISDVMGEWGRWCDVIVMQERDGPRTKVSTLKRVRTERRIVATRSNGLLVDAKDISDSTGPKVPPEAVLQAVRANPGITLADVASQLNVGRTTVARYVEQPPLSTGIRKEKGMPRGTIRLYAVELTSPPHHTTPQDGGEVVEAVNGHLKESTSPPHHHSISGEVDGEVATAVRNGAAIHVCAVCLTQPVNADSDLCLACDEMAER